MKKLTKEEVLHVARLARIKLNDDEIENYRVSLSKLLSDVDKINDIKGYDDDKMIAPWQVDTKLRNDEDVYEVNTQELLRNAKNVSGNYITVPVVVKDEGGA